MALSKIPPGPGVYFEASAASKRAAFCDIVKVSLNRRIREQEVMENQRLERIREMELKRIRDNEELSKKMVKVTNFFFSIAQF